jgi:hypothetical protein
MDIGMGVFGIGLLPQMRGTNLEIFPLYTLCAALLMFFWFQDLRGDKHQNHQEQPTALSTGSTYQRFDFYWQEKGSASSQNIPTGLHVRNRQQSIEKKQ